MMLHILGFLTVVILVYLGMQYYVAFWLIRSFPGLPVAPAVVRAVVLGLALLFPLSIYLLRHASPATHSLATVMYVWTGVLLIWVFWAACGDVLLLAASRLTPSLRARPFIAWGVLAAVALSSVYAVWNAGRLPRGKEVEVPLPRLPHSLDGFTVVQISDLHLGVTVPLERFESIVSLVNGLRPDLIVLTGDLVDPGPAPEEAIARIGTCLKARHGKLAVLGNHEYYHGLEAALECYKRCGARIVLRAP
ncbi:MAG: metallophosphoesterase [Elusimicrobia bacterium]|nr:metallophosphoesterase [Elusimicrobiota bacterium]